jgi:hypothetical protein
VLGRMSLMAAADNILPTLAVACSAERFLLLLCVFGVPALGCSGVGSIRGCGSLAGRHLMHFWFVHDKM